MICFNFANASEFKVVKVETTKEFSGIIIVTFSSIPKAGNSELQEFFRVRRPFSYELVIKKIDERVVLIDPSPDNLLEKSSFNLVIYSKLTNLKGKELDRDYSYDYDCRKKTFKEWLPKKQEKNIAKSKIKKKKMTLTMSPQ
jgi:hypothetical protein